MTVKGFLLVTRGSIIWTTIIVSLSFMLISVVWLLMMITKSPTGVSVILPLKN